jgi:hypothetical protein
MVVAVNKIKEEGNDNNYRRLLLFDYIVTKKVTATIAISFFFRYVVAKKATIAIVVAFFFLVLLQ